MHARSRAQADLRQEGHVCQPWCHVRDIGVCGEHSGKALSGLEAGGDIRWCTFEDLPSAPK